MKQEVKMYNGRFKEILKTIIKDWRLYVLLTPMVIWFFLWAYKPMGGLLMAFQRYEPALGISGSEFRGLGNFQVIVSGVYSSRFWSAFRNTFLISLYGFIFGFPIPIILALFFSEIGSAGFRKITQTITYLPHFLSEVTITSIVLMLVYHGERMTGVVAQFLYNLKIVPEGTKIMDTPNYFKPLYIITGIWKEAGYNSIVYFAAIMGISPVLYEAIRVDGGNKLQEIRYVTLPGMAPTLIIMIILRIGRMLSVGYERVLLLYNPNIYSSADVLSTFEQRIGIIEGVYAVGSAAGMFNSIIGFALVIAANFISRRVSKTSLW
ncbi:MAG TPA: sugar ABC transporter permease [Acholeplasmataceae bacterium]|nr:sugar ABC transporter permease [Acholeplasmataceae bacterium]